MYISLHVGNIYQDQELTEEGTRKKFFLVRQEGKRQVQRDRLSTIAKRDHSRIVPTGDYALNSLGLSTQVPANAVYLTDGSPRRISVGKGHGIMFKHTSELKALSFRSDLMMRIVAAMRAIGEGKITDEQKRILKEHIKNVAEEDYNEDIKLAPAWVRKVLIAL